MSCSLTPIVTDHGFGQIEYTWMDQDELVQSIRGRLGHRVRGIGASSSTGVQARRASALLSAPYWGGPNAVHVTQTFLLTLSTGGYGMSHRRIYGVAIFAVALAIMAILACAP